MKNNIEFTSVASLAGFLIGCISDSAHQFYIAHNFNKECAFIKQRGQVALISMNVMKGNWDETVHLYYM